MTSSKYTLLKLVDYNEQYGRHIIKKYADEIKGPIKEICDLGVGFGDDLIIFKKKYSDIRLIGIDYSNKNERELNAKGIEVKVHNIEADEFDLPDNSIDVIIINQVLEHVKEIFWTHHQIAKKLKIGGHLIVGVPNISSLLNRITFLAGRQPSQLKTYSAHVRGYAYKEIPKFMEVCFSNGYTLIKSNGSQFYPFPKNISRFMCSVFPSLGHTAFYLFRKEKDYTGQFLEHPIKAKLETNFYLGNQVTIYEK